MKKLLLFTLMLVLSAVFVNSAIQDDMIGYWTFDNADTVGNIAVDSQGNINGTLLNNVESGTDGILNQGYGFGSNNDGKHVDLTTLARPSGHNFSFQVWLFSNDTGFGGTIGTSDSGADDWILDQVSASRFRFFTITTNGFIALAGQTIAMNQWRHLVGTYDNKTMKLYINGTEQVAAVQTGNLVTTTNPVVVGAYSAVGFSDDYDGLIDEVGIWNRTLSAAEVLQLYNNGSAFPFPFNEIVEIETNTYNVTNALANNTEWRNNVSFPIPINTTTPTVTFDLDSSGNCTIGTEDLNFTDSFSGDNNRLCATLDTTMQTCTLPSTDPVIEGLDLIYLSCVNANQIQIGTSTSGLLTLNLTIPPIPPSNVTGNFSCLIQDTTCINGEFKCLLAEDGSGNEVLTSKDAFNISCQSINMNNNGLLIIFYVIALILIILGIVRNSPMLGIAGSFFGLVTSTTILYQFPLIAASLLMIFGGVAFVFAGKWLGGR